MSKTKPVPPERLARIRRNQDAYAILAGCEQWKPDRDVRGKICFLIPGSKGQRYRVTTVYCSCPDSTQPRADRVPGPCKHRLAVQLYERIVRQYTEHRKQIQALAQSQEVSYANAR